MRTLPASARLPLPIRILQLGLAGLFAAVLPFICWGAQANPGHPHAGPHFVFAAPPEVRPALPSQMTLAELREWNRDSFLCGATLHAPGDPSPAPGTLAGQSVPKVLVVTLLLLVALLVATWGRPKQQPESRICLGALSARAASLPPSVPPPRIAPFTFSLLPA